MIAADRRRHDLAASGRPVVRARHVRRRSGSSPRSPRSLAAVAGLAWAAWPGRGVRIPAEPAGTLGLRQRYLRHIDELEQQVAADELAPRALHHELSRTLRRFAGRARHRMARRRCRPAPSTPPGSVAVAAAVRRFEHPQFEAASRWRSARRARRRHGPCRRHGAHRAGRRERCEAPMSVLAFSFRQAWMGVLVLAVDRGHRWCSRSAGAGVGRHRSRWTARPPIANVGRVDVGRRRSPGSCAATSGLDRRRGRVWSRSSAWRRAAAGDAPAQRPVAPAPAR